MIQQVWLCLAFTVVLIIVLMTYFSWFYKHGSQIDSLRQCGALLRGAKVMEKLSFYSVYVANILTNHGNNMMQLFILYMNCVRTTNRYYENRNLFAIRYALVSDSGRLLVTSGFGISQQLLERCGVLIDFT